MTARQHHYVPQCYLKGFVHDRDKPLLYVTDGKERTTFRTAPLNVAKQRDFHTIEIDGQPSDAFESAFAKFESELSWALLRIIEARSIDHEDDRAFLMNLLGLCTVKNPRFRETMRGAMSQSSKIMMELATATPERWRSQVKRAAADGFMDASAADDYEGMRAFVEAGQYEITVSPQVHLEREMKIFDNVLPLLFERKWMLLRAPPGQTGFVTTDHPSCLMWSEPSQRGGFYPPGLALHGTQLVFPISNELAMIGAFEIEDGAYDADPELIGQVNAAIIAHADRQVYARDSDFSFRMAQSTRVMRGGELLEHLSTARLSPD